MSQPNKVYGRTASKKSIMPAISQGQQLPVQKDLKSQKSCQSSGRKKRHVNTPQQQLHATQSLSSLSKAVPTGRILISPMKLPVREGEVQYPLQPSINQDQLQMSRLHNQFKKQNQQLHDQLEMKQQIKQLGQQKTRMNQKPLNEQIQQKLVETPQQNYQDEPSMNRSPGRKPSDFMAANQIQDSEYGSLGRQDKDYRYYQQVRRSQTGSEEISEDHQVAEEDMGSFIKHRNAYLDDEITTESQLFKQQPKLGKDPRPNPNQNSYPRQLSQQRVLASVQSHSSHSRVSSHQYMPSPNPGTQLASPSDKPKSHKRQQPSSLKPTHGMPQQTRAMTQLAQPSFASKMFSSDQKRRGQGLQRVETLTSVGNAQGSKPHMYPLEENKQMIHYEMNLLARANRQQEAIRDYSQGHPGSTLLNKATLCDSTNSKQNTLDSAYLRKSLWLLTDSRSKAMKDLVQKRQASCQICQYLKGINTAASHASFHTLTQPNSIRQTNEQEVDQPYKIPKASPHKRANLSSASPLNTNVSQPNLMSAQNTAKSQSLLATQHQSSSALAHGLRLGHAKGQKTKIRKNTTGQFYDRTQISGRALYGSMTVINAITLEIHEQDYLRLLAQKTLNSRYLTSQEYYNSKIASDIMYNEQRHIVSVFKEYLIFDDFSEYLKRFYTKKEANERLPRVFEFYEQYSKVFPNYVAVPESNYMFKNIERKQKLIDQRHQLFLKNQQKARDAEEGVNHGGYKHSANILFGSQFLREVYEDDSSFSNIIEKRERVLTAPDEQREELETMIMNRPSGQQTDLSVKYQTVPPQKRHDEFAKSVKRSKIELSSSRKIMDTSANRHQNELEQVITLLSRYDMRDESAISMAFSSRPSETGGPGHSRQGSDAFTGKAIAKVAGRQKSIAKTQTQAELDMMKGQIFNDKFNIPEPSHDLSMSSWALTSFLNDGDMRTAKSSVGQKIPQGKGESIKGDMPPSDGEMAGEDEFFSPSEKRHLSPKIVPKERIQPRAVEVKRTSQIGQIVSQKVDSKAGQKITLDTKMVQSNQNHLKTSRDKGSEKASNASKRVSEKKKKSSQNLAENGRCRSKLSLGSLQNGQSMVKQTAHTMSKKQIQQLIADTNLKLQSEQSNQKPLVSIQKRVLGSTTKAQSIGNVQGLEAYSAAGHRNSVSSKQNNSRNNMKSQSFKSGGVDATGIKSQSSAAANTKKVLNFADDKGINERFADMQKTGVQSTYHGASSSMSANLPTFKVSSAQQYHKQKDLEQFKEPAITYKNSFASPKRSGVRHADNGQMQPRSNVGANKHFPQSHQLIETAIQGVNQRDKNSALQTQGLQSRQRVSALNSGRGSNKNPESTSAMIENILNGRQIQANQAASPRRKNIIPTNAMVNNLINPSQPMSAVQSRHLASMQSQSKMSHVTGSAQIQQTIVQSHQSSQKKSAVQPQLTQLSNQNVLPASSGLASSQQQVALMNYYKNNGREGDHVMGLARSTSQGQQLGLQMSHAPSKSHEPKERQKYETDHKLARDKVDQQMSQQQLATTKQCLMLSQLNQAHNMQNYQTMPTSSQNKSNPYSKTGRVLSSLAMQKNQGLTGTQAINVGSQSTKGRNKNAPVAKGIQKHGSTVSSSSSIGSKIGAQQAAINSQNVYLKTLTRTNAGSTLSNKNGKESNLGVRKTPGSSQSSTKAKKVKLATQASGMTPNNQNKVAGQLSNHKSKKNFGQTMYPTGMSQGNTIFSVQMPKHQ